MSAFDLVGGVSALWRWVKGRESTPSGRLECPIVGHHPAFSVARHFPLPLFPAKAGIQAFSFMAFFVYLLASRRNGTLYLGYTDDIFRRVAEHRAHSLGGFSAKYKVEYLVWYETHETRESAC